MDTQPELSPVFLVGCPRSGTTLLQRLLDAHPLISIAPETHFVRRFWLPHDKYGDLVDGDGFGRLLADVVTMKEFCEMGLDPGAFKSAARRVERSVPAVFGLMLRLFAERCGASLVGEKTPNHLLYMPTLEHFFPRARFIHIYRDPRAVVSSWKSVPWSTGSIAGDTRVWRRYMRTAWRHHPRPGALHTVRYEALVKDPGTELLAICDFLRITYDPAMLTFHQRPPVTLNLVREPWKGAVTAEIRSAAVDSWRRKLAPEEVAEIERLVWPEMLRLRYPLDAGGVKLALWASERAARTLASQVARLVNR